jgi:MurNAc alpha-1-phosphate uridylyltransferase
VSRDSGRLTYSGVGMFRREFFDGASGERFPLLPLLNRGIAARRVRGELHRGAWSDVGTPERLAALDARLRALQ